MTDEPSQAIKLTGTDEPTPPSRTLRAGPLTAVLEAGALRTIAFGGQEAIRGIAFVVRDRNWATYGATIEDLVARETGEAFHVTYRARCDDGEQSLSYDVEIEGRAEGTLEFRATGAAETDFETNRTGFAVLHPIEGVAGAPVTVIHTDGTVEHATFPDLVMPSQPFFDIRAIAHDVAAGVRVTCTMEGDAYEMEDQRNWTDASYKTYIRPLSKPRPYTLPGGERFTQRVGLVFDGPPPDGAADEGEPVIVAVGQAQEGRVPELALAVDPARAEEALAVADQVRATGVTRLVCTFDAGRHGSADMARFAVLGDRLGAHLTLEAVLPLTDATGAFTADPHVLARDVEAVRHAAEAGGATFDVVAPSPACYLTSHQPAGPWPDAPALEAVYAGVRAAFPDARVAGGMHSYFTELNRKWPPLPSIDVITHSTTAIVHAADDLSVMETLEALPSVFRTVKAHAGHAPYHIGPSAIGMRFNPYGAGTVDNPGNRRLAMAMVDPRQRGLFNAAWSLGYAARAAVGGVDSLCLSAPTGPFAIMWPPAPWPQPWYERNGEKAPLFPVFHVIAGLARHGGAAALTALSSRPADVSALAIAGADWPELWLSNLTASPREVVVEGLDPVATDRLDSDTFTGCAASVDGFVATRAPVEGNRLTIAPYGVVRVVTG